MWTQIETATQLAQAAMYAANNYKTVYVLGCFGAPMTAVNKTRYLKQQAFNRGLTRKAKINAASADTFGFDCVGLIKGLLWGWNGNTEKLYGGAAYIANNVPDIGANAMIALCEDVSKDFSAIEVGEVVWTSGHIGIYVGDGLAVECTYRWEDGVQVTAVLNIGTKSGYHGRKWTSHGKLPYIAYRGIRDERKPDCAKDFTKSYAGTYKVSSIIGLKLRTGAGTSKAILETMANRSSFTCYGYHTGSWLYGISASGKQGFAHKSLLKKK